jgi:hypothetical protein
MDKLLREPLVLAILFVVFLFFILSPVILIGGIEAACLSIQFRGPCNGVIYLTIANGCTHETLFWFWFPERLLHYDYTFNLPCYQERS